MNKFNIGQTVFYLEVDCTEIDVKSFEISEIALEDKKIIYLDDHYSEWIAQDRLHPTAKDAIIELRNNLYTLLENYESKEY